MALEPPLSLRTPTALPNYAHPPLVSVRLGIRCPDPVLVDLEALAAELGPSWLKSSRPVPVPRRTPLTLDGERPLNVFAGVLDDQRLEVHAEGIDFIWDGSRGEAYPHYEPLRDVFVAAFDAWSHCASALPVIPQRWHVSYWNRIPQGTVWSRLDDLGFCRLLASTGETPFAQQLVDFHQTWTYNATPPQAQMRCDAWLESGGNSTGENAIWLALTSSGESGPSETDPELVDVDSEWLSGLDAGRRSIVSGFRGLMSSEANAYWGLGE